jgi:glycine/D-amino acid oxidase-like deaminating enzyme
MGPWSLIAAGWLSLPAVFGQRSPSLVYNTGTDVPADALFLDYHEESGAVVTVEVFPKANGNTLVTAFSDQAPLPFDPAAVVSEPGEIDRLQTICERLSPKFHAEKIIARQACFRPVTQDGLPLIGKVPGVEAAYVATGHNVWGILNAPATGEALAELIADGASRSTDLTPLRPDPSTAARPRAAAPELTAVGSLPTLLMRSRPTEQRQIETRARHQHPASKRPK